VTINAGMDSACAHIDRAILCPCSHRAIYLKALSRHKTEQASCPITLRYDDTLFITSWFVHCVHRAWEYKAHKQLTLVYAAGVYRVRQKVDP